MTTLRPARPADYDQIAAVVDLWWGRPVLGLLPRLFLDHFHTTSVIAEGPARPAGRAAELHGFLIGFASPSLRHEAYIHFVGVCPDARGTGLGRRLFQTFFDLALAQSRSVVRSITSPSNLGSIEFHRAMGFTVTGPVTGYDGPGTASIVFERRLEGGAGTGDVAAGW